MMSTTTRYGMALGFVAAVAIAGSAFGQSGSLERSDPDRAAARAHGKHGRIVTGTMTMQTADGFSTRRIDAGTVSAVDARSIVIERADGERVEVSATDRTRVARDGERVELAHIQTGDHAIVVRIDTGDGLEARSIRALSPEALEERSNRAEEWRERAQEMRQRKHEMRERFRRWRQDRQRV